MEKKKKEPKKKLESFDKIDIKTATDDDIIKSGIKYNTPKDVTCYFIMFLIVVLAFLPLILRIVIPRKKVKEERDITYTTLVCYKTVARDFYELSTKLTSVYRADSVDNVKIEFSYFKTDAKAKEGYTFVEIEKFEELNSKGVKGSKEVGKANYSIDFANYPELKDNDTLEYYAHLYAQEATLLHDDGYSCRTESETKREVVYIDTGKKVE